MRTISPWLISTPPKSCERYSATADLGEQALKLAEAALALHAPRIACDLRDGLGISGDPGKAVGCALLALERRRIDLAADGDLGRYGVDRAVAERGGGLSSGIEERNKLRAGGRLAAPQSFGGSQIVLLMRKNQRNL